MRIDTEQKGLNSLYLPHTAKLLQIIWDMAAVVGRGVSIKDLSDRYNLEAEECGLETKNRATIYIGLQELEADGVIAHYKEPCKGGHKKMYYQLMSPLLFSDYVQRKLGDKMASVFRGPWWKP